MHCPNCRQNYFDPTNYNTNKKKPMPATRTTVASYLVAAKNVDAAGWLARETSIALLLQELPSQVLYCRGTAKGKLEMIKIVCYSMGDRHYEWHALTYSQLQTIRMHVR
jgi:hypothetical protein